ncbi:MAG: hypothetical protein H0U71_03315 [Gammaproteobacteria bacterium]|nr:hypothetical protein [Gammaproteobacteria bacterium]
MQLKPTANDDNSALEWETYKDLLINRSLFDKGLLVIQTNSEKIIQDPPTTSNSFTLNNRQLTFYYGKTQKSDSKPLILAKKLLLQLDPNLKTEVTLQTTKRRDEVFLPLLLAQDTNNIGLYVYLWTSNPRELNFSRFRNFVTCGCFFGSALEAVTDSDEKLAFINHNLPSGLKIKTLNLITEVSSPYEEVLFSEQEKIALLIKNFSKQGQDQELIFHLPYYDYALFGIKFFLRSVITFSDLDKFIQLIFMKAENYEMRLRHIFGKHNINLSIQSPFDNLFGDIKEANVITRHLLACLNLPYQQQDYSGLLPEQLATLEQDLVEVIITKLQTHNYYLDHQETWLDLTNRNNTGITNLEDVFKLANSMMIAIASKGKKHNETCSILPLTEKQIQVHHSSIKISDSYPSVFNMTVVDPVITYSAKNKGILFYQDAGRETLAELLTDKKILQYAYKNISFFANHASQIGDNYDTNTRPSLATILHKS